jgi:starvation-inducible DNA-binding protein
MSNGLTQEMHQAVADLNLFYVKLHNYHWHVEGHQFFQLHKATEAYYDKVTELYDDVAERLLQLGEKAPASVKEYLELAKFPESSKKAYTAAEILTALIEDFSYFQKQFKRIESLAGEGGDTVTEAMANEILAWIEKTLWMLKQSR